MHRVVIRYDKCRLTLNLPDYFDACPMSNMRKTFKLLKMCPHQNQDAFEILDQFLPAWEQMAKDKLNRAQAELTAAKQDAAEKLQSITELGSMIDLNIEYAKQLLVRAKRQPDVAKECRTVLKEAMQPKIDCEQAVKAVKRLEVIAKRAEADLKRSRQIVNNYQKLRRPSCIKTTQ